MVICLCKIYDVLKRESIVSKVRFSAEMREYSKHTLSWKEISWCIKPRMSRRDLVSNWTICSFFGLSGSFITSSSNIAFTRRSQKLQMFPLETICNGAKHVMNNKVKANYSRVGIPVLQGCLLERCTLDFFPWQHKDQDHHHSIACPGHLYDD